MTAKTVRIGGASGYWGDSSIGPRQLVEHGDVDYLMLDYLAEITMSILATAKARDEHAGYATDFITRVIQPLIRPIHERGIKVIANAGGVNLEACRQALEKVAADAGIELKVGTVEGDDLMPQIETLRRQDIRELDSGAALPERLMSANAYLGALPIAAALDAGADIVITGRCVDSALAAGPLIHAFGWRADDYDRLAAAGLVGHLIECGAQATGGNFSDWQQTADGWADTGFPIAEVSADGSFVLTKPDGTGGLVSPLTAGEQMLYELGDPANYILPDVICDFSRVTMTQAGPDRVHIEGARGREPTATYKVSATYRDGYACIGSLVIAGENAVERAQRQGEAVLARTRRLFEREGLDDFSKHAIQVVGSESVYGAHASDAARQSREVVLRLGIHHPSRDAAEIFSREFAGAGLSMSPGLTMLAPGRPKVRPIVRLFSFLLDKTSVTARVRLDGEPIAFTQPAAAGRPGPSATAAIANDDDDDAGPTVEVALRRIAVARSGDKGDNANIGVIARRPDDLPAIRAALSPQAVAARFAGLTRGPVERFECPGIHALNFLLHETLDGGGVASLHLDAQAKTYAQVLLDMPVRIPVGRLET